MSKLLDAEQLAINNKLQHREAGLVTLRTAVNRLLGYFGAARVIRHDAIRLATDQRLFNGLFLLEVGTEPVQCIVLANKIRNI